MKVCKRESQLHGNGSPEFAFHFVITINFISWNVKNQTLFRRIYGIRRTDGSTGSTFDAFVGIDDIDGVPLGNCFNRADRQTSSSAGATVSDEVCHKNSLLSFMKISYKYLRFVWLFFLHMHQIGNKHLNYQPDMLQL
jgi:hypothetical protein